MTKYKFLIIVSFILLYQSVITAQNEWQLLGLENLTIEHIYAKGDTIWAGIDSTYQRKIYYSYNGGEEWQKVDDTTPLINGWLRLLRVDPEDNRTIYARTFNGRGLKSTDGGKSWQYLFPEAEPWNNEYKTKKLHLSPHNKKVMFSIVSWGSWDQLYRTTDGGESWLDVSAFVVSNHGSKLAFAYDPIDSSTIYVAGDDYLDHAAFYASYDLGDSWHINSLLPIYTSRIFVDWDNNNRIYLFPSLLRSEDGGLTWTYITDDPPSAGWVLSSIMDAYDSSLLYVSTWGGIYKASNFGKQWDLIPGSENLDLSFASGSYYDNIFVDSSTYKLYVGTKQGLYKYDLLTSVEEEKENIPGEFILHQNYPNPFNNSTIISYQLAEGGVSPKGGLAVRTNVELKVYDILGREVATLVNEEQPAGKYTVAFNVASSESRLSSGIYIYKLTAGTLSFTRKMMFLK